jgi:hypothetical protein
MTFLGRKIPKGYNVLKPVVADADIEVASNSKMRATMPTMSPFYGFAHLKSPRSWFLFLHHSDSCCNWISLCVNYTDSVPIFSRHFALFLSGFFKVFFAKITASVFFLKNYSDVTHVIRTSITKSAVQHYRTCHTCEKRAHMNLTNALTT